MKNLNNRIALQSAIAEQFTSSAFQSVEGKKGEGSELRAPATAGNVTIQINHNVNVYIGATPSSESGANSALVAGNSSFINASQENAQVDPEEGTLSPKSTSAKQGWPQGKNYLNGYNVTFRERSEKSASEQEFTFASPNRRFYESKGWESSRLGGLSSGACPRGELSVEMKQSNLSCELSEMIGDPQRSYYAT